MSEAASRFIGVRFIGGMGSQRLIRSTKFIATLLLFLFSVANSRGEISNDRGEDQKDPYDALYDVVMIRPAIDGKTYGQQSIVPLIFGRSEFPFGSKSFEKLNTALDAFIALPQAKIESYSDIKRALLQHTLWAVFDATLDNRSFNRQNNPENRREAQKKIGPLIQRLALSKSKILALPDTGLATAKSGGYPKTFDPKDKFRPFLPTDLFLSNVSIRPSVSKESSWVCMGKARQHVNMHARSVQMRSAFFQFVRLPESRDATADYLEKLNHKEVFPVETQFALVERAFLISDEGELVLSPLVLTTQLRAYLDVQKTVREAEPNATQCVAEFVLQPRELMRGNAIMKAMGPKDVRYKALSQDGGKQDRFEISVAAIRGQQSRLELCTACHSRAGIASLGDSLLRRLEPLVHKEGKPNEIARASAAEKQRDVSWKTLVSYWGK